MSRGFARSRLSALAPVLRPGREAVARNWRALVLIQVCGTLLVVAYYTLEPARAMGDRIGEAKASGGAPFVMAANSFSAVVLPELARRLTRVPRDRPFTWIDFSFLVGFFAGMGLLVDALYRYLGVWFGDEPTLRVIVIKSLVDLLGFTPFIGMPLGTLAFAWRDGDFSFARTARLLAGGGFVHRYVPVLVTALCFWAPILGAMYALPVRLQFPFAALAQAAWGLLFVVVASKRTGD